VIVDFFFKFKLFLNLKSFKDACRKFTPYQGGYYEPANGCVSSFDGNDTCVATFCGGNSSA
jgi:hypothetical protein